MAGDWRAGRICRFFCIVIGAEVWHHRKDIRKNADEAAKKKLKRRFHGRLILYALGICIFLGYGAYLWDGIKTEDIGIEEMEE